jgi:NADH:ubiquinone oxidoreductase subunit 6 (subunit J)
MPFMVIAGFLLPPVLTVVAAWLVRRGASGSFGVAEGATWLAVWLISWAAFLGLAGSDILGTWMLVLVWSGAVAQALLIAIAFREQTRLRRLGSTRVPGGVVLGVGIVLQVTTLWGGSVAAGIPLLSGWVESRRRPTKS